MQWARCAPAQAARSTTAAARTARRPTASAPRWCCTWATATTARRPPTVSSHPYTAYGDDGDDSLGASSGAGAVVDTRLLGGRGDDELWTSLNMGGGPDQDGGPGDDLLWANEASGGHMAGGAGD